MLMVADPSSTQGGAIRVRRENARKRGKSASSADGGSGGYGHVQIAQIQRARILAAMLEVACERGAANVTVAHVVGRSGVSRRTFYDLFADCEECFLIALDDALALTTARVLPAYRSERSWLGRVRAALTALLCFFDEEPKLGRLLVCESLSDGGREALAHRNRVVSTLVAAVDEGRRESGNAALIADLTAEGTVGAVLSILYGNLEAGKRSSLALLTNDLMAMIVLPYLGVGSARRELERATPKVPTEPIERTRLADPFKEAGMRLTYRTARVLMAVAEHPGASNRLIGDTAEIRDQGQVSKLLGRLRRAGMVSNTGLGPGKGAPNAWTLTTSGCRVTDGIKAHTEGLQ
jgi:AcrR family transcriptional regulator